MLFNIQNMCQRRIEIILERFEVKIDGNSCKSRSLLHTGEGGSGKSPCVVLAAYKHSFGFRRCFFPEGEKLIFLGDLLCFVLNQKHMNIFQILNQKHCFDDVHLKKPTKVSIPSHVTVSDNSHVTPFWPTKCLPR